MPASLSPDATHRRTAANVGMFTVTAPTVPVHTNPC